MHVMISLHINFDLYKFTYKFWFICQECMLSLLFYFIAKLTWLDSIIWLSKLNDLLEKYKYILYKLNNFDL
jgi:hypothetical protein